MNINELLVLLDYAQSKLTTMAAAELRRQFQEIETLTALHTKPVNDAEFAEWCKPTDQAAVEPVAWAMQEADGKVYDCICPEEHARHEGSYTVPLFTSPPDVEALRAEISTLDVLLEECKMDWSGDVTQIKAEHKHEMDSMKDAMRLALEALKFIKQWGECALAVEKRDAAIAALEEQLK